MRAYHLESTPQASLIAIPFTNIYWGPARVGMTVVHTIHTKHNATHVSGMQQFWDEESQDLRRRKSQHEEASTFSVKLSCPQAPDCLGSHLDSSPTSSETLDELVFCFFIHKGRDNDRTVSWGMFHRNDPWTVYSTGHRANVQTQELLSLYYCYLTHLFQASLNGTSYRQPSKPSPVKSFNSFCQSPPLSKRM